MKKLEEYLGKTYNCLKIERLVETTLLGHHIVLCKCECGNKVKSKLRSVLAGSVSSCGRCKLKSKANLPLSHTNVYRAWYEANRDSAEDVCEDWWDFENFRRWSVSQNVGDTSKLVRKDLQKPYNPENCTWSVVSKYIRSFRTSPTTGLLLGVTKTSNGKGYRATWDENGKKRQKGFSILKYGEDVAKDLAIDFKIQKNKEMYGGHCDSK